MSASIKNFNRGRGFQFQSSNCTKKTAPASGGRAGAWTRDFLASVSGDGTQAVKFPTAALVPSRDQNFFFLPSAPAIRLKDRQPIDPIGRARPERFLTAASTPCRSGGPMSGVKLKLLFGAVMAALDPQRKLAHSDIVGNPNRAVTPFSRLPASVLLETRRRGFSRFRG